MRALAKRNAAPGLELIEAPVPTPGPGEVVIKVAQTSICGTDVHIFEWDAWAESRIRPPRIVGHETCGEIVAIGADVVGFQAGDFVAAESHITCGRCFQCRSGNAHVCRDYRILGIDIDGALAEYVRLPISILWPTGSEIPREIANLQEPLGNSVHATLEEDVAGRTVLVTGCGPTGLFAIAVARSAGSALVVAVDPSEYRRELARKLGADAVLDVGPAEQERLGPLTADQGFDVALEMSGHPQAIHQAFRMVKNGGRVSLFGIPHGRVEFDITNEIIFKGIRVYGITGRRLFQTWYRMAGLLQAGLNVAPVVTHRLPLAAFEQAFDLMRRGECGKIILVP
jgi:threonine 3-dehydrogenase